MSDLPSLRGLGQAQTTPAWSDQAVKLSSLAVTKQWATLVVAATELAAKALKAQAVPVATTATQTQVAAKAMAAGGNKTDDIEAAILALAGAAQREDDSTAPDRIRNEEVLDKRMDEFERSYSEWQKEHAGFMAIWDKLRGGADLSPFKTKLDDAKAKIDLVPLTTEGRSRLLERHARLVSGLQPGDWKILVATGVGALLLNLIVSKAGSFAASGAAVVATKAQTHVTTKLATRAKAKAGVEKKEKKAAGKKAKTTKKAAGKKAKK
jgi:hypothetical protein